MSFTENPLPSEKVENAAGLQNGLKKVKVSYGASKYLSHSRVAQSYRELLRSHCEAVKDIEKADIVILHFEPQSLESLFETYPALKNKYVIGYCVWEADELPIPHQSGLSKVQEVWTCSRYCSDVFTKHHPRVKCVPHIVERDIDCTDADRQNVQTLISYDPDSFYFLMVTKLWDLRKNTTALAEAFRRQRAHMPKAKLIIKAGPQDHADGLSQEGLLLLREQLSNTQMNALYEVADAYVSPHHSEGWGLTLSDAMIFQTPAIATGYSGNCEFMNPGNSLLLDYTVSNIKPEDCFGHFDQSMKWAYPSQEDLEQKLLFLYRTRNGPEIQQMTRNASQDIRKFNRDAVSEILKRQISEIVDSELFSKRVAKG